MHSHPRLLLAVCVATLCLLAAAGCGRWQDREPTPTSSPSPQPAIGPKLGGILVAPLEAEALTLDPHMATSPATAMIAGAVYNGLLQYDSEGKIAPDLAENWQYSSPTALVVRLRQGVRWQNVPPVYGRELIADDAVYSLKRAATKEPSYSLRGLLSSVDVIRVVDRYTLQITLTTPDVYLLDALANPCMLIVAREVVAQQPTGELANVAVGTGPFVLKEYERAVGGRLERNPDYFVKDRPYLNGVLALVMPDAQARETAFRLGKTDTYRAEPRELSDLMEHIAGARLYTYPYGGMYKIAMNCRRAPFADAHVRQAVRYASDASGYVSVVGQGPGQRASGAVPPAFGKWALPEAYFWEPDVTRAKQLLAMAGYTYGLKTTTEAVAGYNALQSEVMRQQLAAAGIQLSIRHVPVAEWQAHVYRHELDIWAWLDDPRATIDGYIYASFHTGGQRNSTGYSNRAVDDLLESQRRTLDEEQRLRLVQEVQQILWHEAPEIALFTSYHFVLTQPYVQGYHPQLVGRTGSAANLLQDVWLSK